jgi:hypothetical protein
MKASNLPAALFAATLTMLPAAAMADAPPPLNECSTVRTVNLTSSKVWVTIYDLGKTRHLDYGWVDACSYRDWRSGNYACGSYYYVRGEVKNYDLSANVYDTTIQIHGGSGFSFLTNLHKGNGNYYWNTGDPGWNATSTAVFPVGCDASAPPGAPQYNVSLVNNTGDHVKVSIAGEKGPALVNDCVDPHQTKAWKVQALGVYGVTGSPAGSSCANPTTGSAFGWARPANGSASLTFGYLMQQK